MTDNPLTPFLQRQGYLVLDGGLATELEQRGFDLRDPLWSARLLLEAPDVIRQVHLDYLLAGADCITTATYQATIPGFMARGLSQDAAEELLRRAVQLAQAARAQFATHPAAQGRLRPLIAASIGPYGAYLANGAEYTGEYDLALDGLLAFHRPRWQLLAASAADWLACETLPSFIEAQALAQLLQATPGRYAWFSFSCRDERHLSDGTPLAAVAAWLDDYAQVVAVGINCTSPRFIPALIAEVRQATRKPIIVYPNSGERYDPVTQMWQGESLAPAYAEAADGWRAAGAQVLGGCCRTTPEHIARLRLALAASPAG